MLQQFVELLRRASFDETDFWHARLAQVLREEGHYDDAIEEFNISIDEDSNFLWLAHASVAHAYACMWNL